MSKTTAHQRLLKQGQPYTQLVSLPTGEYHVIGSTLEEEQDKEGNYFKRWMQHDLGIHSRQEALKVTAEWRQSLVGSYD